MQCKKCGRIRKTALMPRPHFYCDVCEPPAAPSGVVATVILWLGVMLLVLGAWALVG